MKTRDLNGLSNGHKRAWLLVGRANAPLKNFMPENFLKINRYFALTSYCNTTGQSNNAFSILGFSLAGKRKSLCFDPFIHWLIKQNNEHWPKQFFKVMRKSLYPTVYKLIRSENYSRKCPFTTVHLWMETSSKQYRKLPLITSPPPVKGSSTCRQRKTSKYKPPPPQPPDIRPPLACIEMTSNYDVKLMQHIFWSAHCYCWLARDVTAAMLVVKNKSISLLCELHSIFM